MDYIENTVTELGDLADYKNTINSLLGKANQEQ